MKGIYSWCFFWLVHATPHAATRHSTSVFRLSKSFPSFTGGACEFFRLEHAPLVDLQTPRQFLWSPCLRSASPFFRLISATLASESAVMSELFWSLFSSPAAVLRSFSVVLGWQGIYIYISLSVCFSVGEKTSFLLTVSVLLRH